MSVFSGLQSGFHRVQTEHPDPTGIRRLGSSASRE
jgi:hypothetical protein